MLGKRYISTASLVCSLALGVSGSAFAADDVAVSNTGPDSYQKVEIENSAELNVSNTNTVQVTNENVQEAVSGDVTASKNTSVGDVSSGDATNVNETATTVGVSNTGTSEQPVGGVGTGAGSTGGSTAVVPTSGGRGGSTLGASTAGGLGGVATLPEVGASQFVDVSALRAAWQPKTEAPTAALADKSKTFSGIMLLTATLLSLLGAIGSAWYARRKEERV